VSSVRVGVFISSREDESKGMCEIYNPDLTEELMKAKTLNPSLSKAEICRGRWERRHARAK
jgi:hypothetical protein